VVKDSEKKLSEQHRLLQAAVDNMTDGLIMFDADARVVVCNQRYLQMYNASPEIVRPGCSLRDVLLHRKATGGFFGDVDEYIADSFARTATGAPSMKIREFDDGRVLLIKDQPLEGGGWVATHEDITERRRVEQRIAHLALHDPLTDLPNRMLFRQRLEQALVRVRRGGGLALLYLDIDHFKTVNDTLGHPIGDQLLIGLARRLRECVREIDTVARLGGDEFAVIQSDSGRPEDAVALAARILERMKTPFNFDGHQFVADVSVGIALAPGDAVEAEDLMKSADMALYGSKGDGRGAFRFFKPQMDERMKSRRALELQLRNALARGEFELYYQPIVNLRTNEISTCEALLRWRHPERGLLLPIDFIPAAAELGVIVPIGEWVLRTACAVAAQWPENVRVAVNLAPLQLKSPNLVPVVVNALAAAGLSTSRLEIEITEAVLWYDSAAILAKLHQLRELGVHLVMDDFGSGYASLSHLQSFPFDKIKIEQRLTSGLSEGKDPATIMRMVAALAGALCMISVAEGVETREQLEEVKRLGYTEMQGFLFSGAKTPEDISQFFAAHTGAKEGSTLQVPTRRIAMNRAPRPPPVRSRR